jgi:hypothetical protein
MKTLKLKYQYLSQEDVRGGFDHISERLLKIGKFSDKKTAKNYAKVVLFNNLHEGYRAKFFRIFSSIDTKGILVKDSLTRSVFKEMALRISILNHFKKINYDKSPQKQAVHNAISVFAASPYNSKSTINA